MPASSRKAATTPPIHISEADYDLIADLAMKLERQNPVLSQLLLQEIERARVYTAGRLPKDVVSIGSEVEFTDGSDDARHHMQLVLPQEADVDAGRISVMTPIGAGLIGMREGNAIDWPRRDGRPRTLTIVRVMQPATDGEATAGARP